jgi:hypothetical protein
MIFHFEYNLFLLVCATKMKRTLLAKGERYPKFIGLITSPREGLHACKLKGEAGTLRYS